MQIISMIVGKYDPTRARKQVTGWRNVKFIKDNTNQTTTLAYQKSSSFSEILYFLNYFVILYKYKLIFPLLSLLASIGK